MKKRKDPKQVGIETGAAASVNQSSKEYQDNIRHLGPRGHGTWAEEANHMADRLRGQDAQSVGKSNERNGADRIVNGQYIQSKYCSSGGKCIQECFDANGNFRYLHNGKPMQIEVPKDMYDQALQSMRDRIAKGQIPNVTDPADAEKYVRRGHITYEQATRIAKAGTIEGLTFDAIKGVQVAGSAAGISAVITFAFSIWNGEVPKEAAKNAARAGLQAGGTAWLSHIATSQVSRTGVEKGLRPASEWAVKKLGPKATKWLATLLKGKPLSGAAATSHVSKVLRGNTVAAAITLSVMSAEDLYRLFRGHISGKQAMKNMAVRTAGLAGGTAGGVMAAAAIGTVILPGLGTFTGIVIGALGGLAGGSLANAAAQGVMNKLVDDDQKVLQEILQQVFDEEATLFMLSQTEAKEVMKALEQKGLKNIFFQMQASSDRTTFIREVLVPMMEAQAAKRPRVSPPSEEELLEAAIVLLEEEDNAAD